jgi:hypothetical protein
MSQVRQGLGEPQSKSARILAPRLNPPHATPAVSTASFVPLTATADLNRREMFEHKLIRPFDLLVP